MIRHLRPYSCLAVAASLCLMGCKRGDGVVVGTWHNGQMTITATADHQWSEQVNQTNIMAGTWSFDGTDVTFKPVSVAGKPVADVKHQIEQFSGNLGAQAKQFGEDLDKPRVFHVSEEGTHLQTDKRKDYTTGPVMVFEK